MINGRAEEEEAQSRLDPLQRKGPPSPEPHCSFFNRTQRFCSLRQNLQWKIPECLQHEAVQLQEGRCAAALIAALLPLQVKCPLLGSLTLSVVMEPQLTAIPPQSR